VMIDNPLTAMELLEDLRDTLPLPARMTPELLSSIRNQNAAAPISANCTIIGLHYMGDEGGIVCKLDLGADVQNAAFVSITHLRFDARLPLSRKIIAYQKHRVKRVGRHVSRP
jgi:hypothetical protein